MSDKKSGQLLFLGETLVDLRVVLLGETKVTKKLRITALLRGGLLSGRSLNSISVRLPDLVLVGVVLGLGHATKKGGGERERETRGGL